MDRRAALAARTSSVTSYPLGFAEEFRVLQRVRRGPCPKCAFVYRGLMH
jgi:hypothetical protein